VLLDAGFENVRLKKIAGLSERIGIYFLVKLFNRGQSSKKQVLIPMGLWRLANNAISAMMRFTVLANPLFLTNSALLHCEKRRPLIDE
ncbi:hypothetical protein LCGC14_2871430, partial [marine sediment metagenome]